ncbi:chymotrypsin B-like isoform X2 [Convolutriloba macropyga]|uniref:chymotrypsin B-like isoform X2 n=1 Tax=Convolutriloba macropyga TaxID=536237 RepID=UPI003F5207C3
MLIFNKVLELIVFCFLLNIAMTQDKNYVSSISEKTLSFATNSISATRGRFYVRINNIKATKPTPIHWMCGGAAINTRWIVTAAQCLISWNGTKIRNMKVERTDFTVAGLKSTTVPVTNIIVHPKFSVAAKSVPVNDIGLVRVNLPLSKRKPIKLCSDSVGQGTSLHLLTMGAVRRHRVPIFPKVLQQVAFTASTFRFSDIWNMELCPEYNICTDPVSAGTHLCIGDIGSPLIKKACPEAKHPRITECLMGVASYSKNDKIDDSLSLSMNSCSSNSFFSSIPYFYEWISATVRNNTM